MAYTDVGSATNAQIRFQSSQDVRAHAKRLRARSNGFFAKLSKLVIIRDDELREAARMILWLDETRILLRELLPADGYRAVCETQPSLNIPATVLRKE